MVRLTALILALVGLIGPLADARAERRVALVIGNGAYVHTSPLANPRNDAADVAAALKRLGFTVVEGYDLDKRQMDQVFVQFARMAADAETGFVYYAGHGATFANVPYLVPIDAKFEDETSVAYELSRLEDVVAELRRAKGVRIAIIDACRDNQAEQALKRRLATTRGIAPTRGLALPSDRTGLLITYATQPLDVALDTSGGRNSPFTEALLRHMETPGLDVRLMMTRVKSDVFEKTKRSQLPEVSDSLIGEFQLKAGPSAALAPANVAPAGTAPPVPVAPLPNPESEAWNRIQQSNDIATFEAFLARFPSGPFAEAARAKIGALKAVAASRRLAFAQTFQLATCGAQSLGRSLEPNWTWHYPRETPTVMNGARRLVCKSGKSGLLYTRESEIYQFFVANDRWVKSTEFSNEPCAAINQYCAK